jgi:hypothetical protein
MPRNSGDAVPIGDKKGAFFVRHSPKRITAPAARNLRERTLRLSRPIYREFAGPCE